MAGPMEGKDVLRSYLSRILVLNNGLYDHITLDLPTYSK